MKVVICGRSCISYKEDKVKYISSASIIRKLENKS